MQCRTIFFDLDGTLAESKSMRYNVYRSFLASFDASGTQTEFKMLDGNTIQGVVSQLRINHSINKTDSFLLKQYKEALVKNVDKISPITGAEETLELFKKKDKKLVLVTSAESTFVQPFLDKHNWNDYFEAIVTGELVKQGKPEPDLYEKAVEVSGCLKGEVVVVEDSDNGVRAATAAGLTVIRIRTHERNWDEATSEFEVSSLQELATLIE